MVTPITIPPGMQIERSGLCLLPVGKAGGADQRRRKANRNEQTGQQGDKARRLSGSAIVMHQTE